VASLAVALTTFAIILLAELPDKTALASLVLGTRYRPGPVLCGIAAGFTVHVVLAVAAGSLLGLLPHQGCCWPAGRRPKRRRSRTGTRRDSGRWPRPVSW